jgi:cyclic pyranopterin phosphate synthase
MGEDKMLKDSFGRVHDYLRISLTDNCNLRCFYCMPEEDYVFTPASKVISAEEVEAIARIFVDAGVKKIRLTGGEPLVRHDSAEIISSLAKMPIELTLTTNGTRLHTFIDVIKDAKIKSLNVSLDTLKPGKFAFIARRNQFAQVWKNIHLLLENNFHVKINVVVMRGVNESEITDFIELTKDLPLHVRFIEFMPFAGNRWTSNQVFTMADILKTISARYHFLPLEKVKHDTAKKFIVPGHRGTFAIISTMSAHFCGDCNRMRLTADGKLKNCLFSKTETDLLTAFRNGDDITGLIKATIQGKHEKLGGQLRNDYQDIHPEEIQNRSMITIGG